MSLKKFLLIISALTLASFCALLAVIYFFNPNNASIIPVLLFYSTFSITLLGALTLTGFLARFLLARRSVAFREIAVSFRHAILLTILMIISLLMNRYGVFNLLSLVLLILALTVAEVIFSGSLGRKAPHN